MFSVYVFLFIPFSLNGIFLAFEFTSECGWYEEYASLEFFKPIKLLFCRFSEKIALVIDVANIFGLRIFGLDFIVFDGSVTMNEWEKFHGHLEKFIGLDRMYVKVESDFFSSLFDKEPVLFFLDGLLFLGDRLGNFVKIFFIKLLKFGPENFSEYLIDFYEMAKLNHAIGFVDNEVLQILKVENLIFEELVNSAWCPNNYVWFALTYDSELFLLWHTTNDGYYRDIAFDMFKYLCNILLNLLGKLSGRGNYQPQQNLGQLLKRSILNKVNDIWQHWQSKGQSFTRAGLRCN